MTENRVTTQQAHDQEAAHPMVNRATAVTHKKGRGAPYKHKKKNNI
jgi:hypothetical protein